MSEVTIICHPLRIKWCRTSKYSGYFSVPCYGTVDRDRFNKLMEFQADVPLGLSLKEYKVIVEKKMKIFNNYSVIYQFNAIFKEGLTKEGPTKGNMIDDCEYVRMSAIMGHVEPSTSDKIREITQFEKNVVWPVLNFTCNALNFVLGPIYHFGAK